jgi:hypothetical protein
MNNTEIKQESKEDKNLKERLKNLMEIYKKIENKN